MGSPFGCIGASSANIMHVLRDYMMLLEHYPTIHYLAGQKIACKEHSVFPYLVRGYFCAFAEGNNVPTSGVNGSTLLLKMQQMIEHGCQGCGSVPLEKGNDPDVMGKLTVNYVTKSECVGLCFYGKNGYVQQTRFVDDNDDVANGIHIGQRPSLSPASLAVEPSARRGSRSVNGRNLNPWKDGGDYLQSEMDALFPNHNNNPPIITPTLNGNIATSGTTGIPLSSLLPPTLMPTITTMMTTPSPPLSVVSVRYIPAHTLTTGLPGLLGSNGNDS